MLLAAWQWDAPNTSLRTLFFKPGDPYIPMTKNPANPLLTDSDICTSDGYAWRGPFQGEISLGFHASGAFWSEGGYFDIHLVPILTENGTPKVNPAPAEFKYYHDGQAIIIDGEVVPLTIDHEVATVNGITYPSPFVARIGTALQKDNTIIIGRSHSEPYLLVFSHNHPVNTDTWGTELKIFKL